MCDRAPACAQNKCTPARDGPLRESAGALAFRIQVTTRSGRMGAQLNVPFCELACSRLTRAEPPDLGGCGAAAGHDSRCPDSGNLHTEAYAKVDVTQASLQVRSLRGERFAITLTAL